MAEIIDMTGETYGFLRVDTYDKKHDAYHVTCYCGKKFILEGKQVRRRMICACRECEEKYFPSTRRNITGRRYGVLTVVRPNIEEDGKFHRKWVCECSHCETWFTASAGPLINGELFSCPICGAGMSESDQRDKNFSLRARRFGSLTVRYHSINKRLVNPDNDDWECRCACGEQVTFTRKELLSGLYKDCGCGCNKRKK